MKKSELKTKIEEIVRAAFEAYYEFPEELNAVQVEAICYDGVILAVDSLKDEVIEGMGN